MLDRPAKQPGSASSQSQIDPGLHQEDVARQLGSLREVYDRWERDEHQPVVSERPEIIAFLGYYPFNHDTAASQVLKARRCQGMDQNASQIRWG